MPDLWANAFEKSKQDAAEREERQREERARLAYAEYCKAQINGGQQRDAQSQRSAVNGHRVMTDEDREKMAAMKGPDRFAYAYAMSQGGDDDVPMRPGA